MTKILEVSLQHEEEVQKAIDFNRKQPTDDKYIIRADSDNLILTKCVTMLLRAKYTILCGYDCLTFKFNA